MKTALGSFILVFSLASGAAWGAESGPSSSPAMRDPAMERYASAAERQDWAAAAAAMKDAVSRDAGNADFNNLYAYSLRRGKNPDMNLVFKHYNEALRLDPRHKGAHEYIGEAYLMAGNLAKAKEHLGALNKLCFFGCSEFSDLKKAIAEFEVKAAKR